MITPGLPQALYVWAYGNSTRIAQLVTERDALVTAFLSGGKPSTTLNSASLNGKSFAALVSLSREDKLDLLTEVLVMLDEVTPMPTVVVANFQNATR